MNSIREIDLALKTRRRVELGGLTLLVGANGAGKSSVLQGLQYLATGRVPGVLDRDLERLSPDGEGIRVRVVCTDGGAYVRGRKGGKTHITLEPGRGERTIAQKEGVLAKTFGSPYLLDIGTLVGLPAPEQRRRLLELSSANLTRDAVEGLVGPTAWRALEHLWHDDATAFVNEARLYAAGRRLEVERILRMITVPPEPTDVSAALGAATERAATLSAQDVAYKTVQRLMDELGRIPPLAQEGTDEQLAAARAAQQEAEARLAALRQQEPDEQGILRILESGYCPLARTLRCPVEDWADILAAHLDAGPSAVQDAERAAQEARGEVQRLVRALDATRAWETQQGQILARLATLSGVADVSEELAVAEEERTRLVRLDEQRSNWVRMVEHRELVEGRLRTWQGIEAAVGQDSALATAVLRVGFGALTEAADETLRVVGRTEHLLPPGEGGLGLVRDGVPLPWDVLSSGERAVLGLALTLGLIRLQRPEVPVVLLDNFEVLDQQAQAGVLQVLARAGVANAIVASVTAPVAPEGWTVVPL